MSNPKLNRKPKVLFLYSNERTTAYKEVLSGANHGGGFWGLVHMYESGIDAEFIELEHFFSVRISKFLRSYIFKNIYFVHIFFFPKILKYDVIYTSAAFGTQLIYTLYPFKKPKWIMHDFNITNLIGDRKTLKQKIFYWMTYRCNGIITLSKTEADKLRKIFPHLEKYIIWIPFGVDLDFFKPLSNQKKQIVLAVGRDPDRDWDMLIRIAPRINAQIIIATKPQRVSHLQPLPSNVTVGQYSPNEFKKMYDEAKIFALPLDTSKGTNAAMGCSALFEALAMGKAMVVTNTDTISSYISDGENGYLIDEGNEDAFVETINLLLGDDEKRKELENNSREFTLKNLDIHKRSEELASYFEKIVN